MRYIVWFFCLGLAISYSQNKQLLFGYNEIPQSTLINPSSNPDNGFFVGIPLLSHIHANVGLSGVTIYDLFADDGIDFNTKLRNVVDRLDRRDFFTFNQQLDLFSFGFAYGNQFKEKEYITMGVYIETDAFIYFPKDLAILAYEGNAGDNLDRVFDFSDVNLRADMVTVFHLGTTKKINKKLTIGARGKIYSSLFNVSSINNRGEFYTESPGENNFYNHVFDLDVNIRTSGFTEFEDSSTSESIRTIQKRILFDGNLGLGLDLGATYQLNERITLEGSIQDIGFIQHNKTVENYVYKGQLEFEGVNPLFPEIADETADYWNEIADQFDELFDAEPTTESYTTLRPLKLNAAARYRYPNENNNSCDCLNKKDKLYSEFGAQLFAIKRPRGPQLALTAYYYKQLFNWLSAKATYTIDSYYFPNIGLGINAKAGAFNMYLMTDNWLKYGNIADAKNVSVQFGMNLIFKKKEF